MGEAPLSRPYPHRAKEQARAFLLRQGHTRNTVKCAEGFNTPLWQKAIRTYLEQTNADQPKGLLALATRLVRAVPSQG